MRPAFVSVAASRRGEPIRIPGLICFAVASPTFRQRVTWYFYPYFQVELAAALGVVARIDDGLAEIDAALRFAQETGHRWFVPETLRIKGELLALRGPGDPAVIADLYRGSMRQAREQHALYWELSAAISLAELLRSHHREAEARAVLAPVYDRFTEGFSAAKVQRAKILLDQLAGH